MYDESSRRAGLMLALCSAVFYSSRSILTKFALMTGAGVRELVALRMIFAALIFIVARQVLEKGHRRSQINLWFEPRMMLGGVCFTTSVILSFYAIMLNGVAMTVVLVYTHPAFVALLARVVYKEQLGSSRTAALALAYTGCAMVVGPKMSATGDEAVLVGALAALGAAFCYALYQILTQSLAKHATSLQIGMVVSIMSIAPSLALWHFDPPSVNMKAIVITAAMGFFSTFLPMYLVLLAIERVGAATASLLSLVGPVAAVSLAWIIFDEHFSAVQWAGTVLVIGAMATTFGRKKALPVQNAKS